MGSELKTLLDKATDLYGSVRNNYFEFGKVLLLISQIDKPAWDDFIAKIGLKTRRAYAYMEIYDAYKGSKIHKAKLAEIGWTKMHLMIPYKNHYPIDDLLTLASENNVPNLERVLRDQKSPQDLKVFTEYFTPKEYAEVERALKAEGMVKGPRGYTNRKEAFLKLIRKVNKAKVDA